MQLPSQAKPELESDELSGKDAAGHHGSRQALCFMVFLCISIKREALSTISDQ